MQGRLGKHQDHDHDCESQARPEAGDEQSERQPDGRETRRDAAHRAGQAGCRPGQANGYSQCNAVGARAKQGPGRSPSSRADRQEGDVSKAHECGCTPHACRGRSRGLSRAQGQCSCDRECGRVDEWPVC